MYKHIILLLGLSSSFSLFAAQNITDIEILNELKQIKTILENNSQRVYTCTDGDKNYTIGMGINHNNVQYTCILKSDHTEWVFVPNLN